MATESIKKDNGVSRWLWWIPILLVVIGLVTSHKRAVYPIAANAQEGPPAYIVQPEEKQVVVDLNGDKMTIQGSQYPWIEIPVFCEARIDPPPEGCDFIAFDGFSARLKPNKPVDLGKGFQRGVFRLQGKGQVMISSQPY